MARAKAQILVGACTPYTCKISKKASLVFRQATEGIYGVRYEPVAVSQQIVSGTNYKFFCNARVAVQYPLNQAAIVSIYQPLSGKAHITNIQHIN